MTTIRTSLVFPTYLNFGMIEYLTPEKVSGNSDAGNGIFDNSDALDALDGHYAKFRRGGTYRIESPFTGTLDSTQWVFEEGASIDASSLVLGTTALSVSGSQGSGVALASDAAARQRTVVVADGSTFSIGQHVRLASNAIWDPGRLNLLIGETAYIIDKSSNTLTMMEDLEFSYLTADSAIAFPIEVLENVLFENMTLLGRQDDSTTTGRAGLSLHYCVNPRILGQTSRYYALGHLGLIDCIGARVDHLYMENKEANNFNYGVVLSGATRDSLVTSHKAVRMGHAITHGGGSASSQAAAGQQRDNTYRDFDILGGNNNGSGGGRDFIDAHSSVIRGRILNGTIRGGIPTSGSAGMNLEGGSWDISGVKIINVPGNALQYSLYNNYDAVLNADFEADGCAYVSTVSENNTGTGRLTSTDIKIRSARRYTGRLCNWSSTQATPRGTVAVETCDADGSSQTDTAGDYLIVNARDIKIRPGKTINKKFNSTIARFDSNHDVNIVSGDVGSVTYESGTNTSANAFQFRSKDIVQQGTFPAPTWVLGTGWTEANGKATHAAGSASKISQAQTSFINSGTIVAGTTYTVQLSLSGRTAGSLTPELDGGTPVIGDTAWTQNGVTLTQTLVAASGNDTLALNATSDFDGSVEYCLLVPVGGNFNFLGDYQFSLTDQWTYGTGWSRAGGVASHTPGTASDLSQTNSLLDANGISYLCTFTVSNRTAGDVTLKFKGSGSTVTGTSRSTNATFSETLVTVADNNSLVFSASSDFDGSIDNFTVLPVITYRGAPVGGEVKCTSTNTANLAALPDAATRLCPIGESRTTPKPNSRVSSVLGSTYILREPLRKTLTANTSIQIPANHWMTVYFSETAGNAVTGGIKIGTTNGGTEVAGATAVAGNAQVTVSLTLFSFATNTTVFFNAVTDWNSASVDTTIVLQYMGQ